MNLLKDKNIIVTGGSRGIGKSIAKKFLNNGANVVFSHFSSQEESESTLNELKKLVPRLPATNLTHQITTIQKNSLIK